MPILNVGLAVILCSPSISRFPEERDFQNATPWRHPRRLQRRGGRNRHHTEGRRRRVSTLCGYQPSRRCVALGFTFASSDCASTVAVASASKTRARRRVWDGAYFAFHHATRSACECSRTLQWRNCCGAKAFHARQRECVQQSAVQLSAQRWQGITS